MRVTFSEIFFKALFEHLHEIFEHAIKLLSVKLSIKIQIKAKARNGFPIYYGYIYIYAFSRRFYTKRLTVHSGYTFIVSMCVTWVYLLIFHNLRNEWQILSSVTDSIQQLQSTDIRFENNVEYSFNIKSHSSLCSRTMKRFLTSARECRSGNVMQTCEMALETDGWLLSNPERVCRWE